MGVLHYQPIIATSKTDLNIDNYMQKLISGNCRYIVRSKTLLLSIIDRGHRPRSSNIVAFPELFAKEGTEISSTTMVELQYCNQSTQPVDNFLPSLVGYKDRYQFYDGVKELGQVGACHFARKIRENKRRTAAIPIAARSLIIEAFDLFSTMPPLNFYIRQMAAPTN